MVIFHLISSIDKGGAETHLYSLINKGLKEFQGGLVLQLLLVMQLLLLLQAPQLLQLLHSQELLGQK